MSDNLHAQFDRWVKGKTGKGFPYEKEIFKVYLEQSIDGINNDNVGITKLNEINDPEWLMKRILEGWFEDLSSACRHLNTVISLRGVLTPSLYSDRLELIHEAEILRNLCLKQ